MTTYLGIDLGTSSIKAVIIDDQLNVLANASSPLPISHPRISYSEQNPSDWWKQTIRTIKKLKKKNKKHFSAIKVIGFSGQQHGATLLNRKGEVLRPAILWNDTRAFEEANFLEKKVPNARLITANRVMPGFTAPKLLWVDKHEKKIFKQIHKILLPKDYLRFKLSGDYATDMSDASGTSWLNVSKRAWSDEMITACHLDINNMPKLYEGPMVTGSLLPSVAKALGLPIDTTLVAGGSDNAATAISANVIQAKRAFLSLGTSGTYFVASRSPRANPEHGVHTFAHCLPKLWHHMNCHLSATNCLNWFAHSVKTPLPTLLKEVALLDPLKVTPLLFLPYFSGERSPYNDPYAKGVFMGLTVKTTRAEMTLAILEGIALNFALGQDAFDEAGIKIDTVSVVGGGARNLYWGKILASVLNRTLIYRKQREIGGCVGAARLAWLSQHVCNLQKKPFPEEAIERRIHPRLKWHQMYEERKLFFKQLYVQLAPVFSNVYSKKNNSR
jgi:xylulokinase